MKTKTRNNLDVNEKINKELQGMMPQALEELTELVRNITKKILSDVAMKVTAVFEWLNKGKTINDDADRMKREWRQAEKRKDTILEKPLKEALKDLCEIQAGIFWIFRGRIENHDEERKKKDYHDAKRHIGFLIADAIIEGCKANTLGDDCLSYLKEEYFEYLIALSLEEYIRIKSYFNWQKGGGIANDDRTRMNSDYFNAMECIHNTMWNCKERTPELFLGQESMELVRKFFSQIEKKRLAEIINAKINTGQRLNFVNSRTVNDFVDRYYSSLQKALNVQVSSTDIFALLGLLYADHHIPNMLDFILRCFLCTYTTTDEHNSIRNYYQKKSLTIYSEDSNKKYCPQ
ncbi:MAG: hypothetical protein EPN22_08765 [Nitrospirae bacterium]|nr:MAG: hypothetical protein EPN22_08765 [Nitrospirota bacterium]